MNKRFQTSLMHTAIALFTAMVFAGCAKEENIVSSKTLISGENLIFSFTEEGFQADKTMTRADNAPVKIDTVDLGNGLIGELSLQPDTADAEPATRATITDGHYTIYMVDSSGNILPSDKTLSGTYSGGVFTPDANKKIDLPAGTYTFICYNDAMVIDTNLEGLPGVKCFRAPSGTACPMLAVTQATLVEGKRTLVNFTLQHKAARFRARVTSYTAHGTDLKVSFSTIGTDCHKGACYLMGDGSYFRNELGATDAPTVTLNKDATPYSLTVKPFACTSDYVYLSEDRGAYSPSMFVSQGPVNITVEGKVHNRSLNKSYSLSPGMLQANKTYLLSLVVKIKEQLYLFEDGGVGYLADRKPGHEPIALVLQEKTESQHGKAVSLQGQQIAWEDENSPHFEENNYKTQFTTNEAAFADKNGYNWTWDSSTDIDGKTKANEQTLYPAFYWAAHYHSVGTWYFPAIGEYMELFDKFAKFKKKETAYGSNFVYEKTLDAITKPFTDAGGMDMFQSIRGWSSTLLTLGPGSTSPVVFYRTGYSHDNMITVRFQGARKRLPCYVFPFVRF